tara:strand:- start:399 stop:545 length:147 start_codon:yes stop_codon:yes gene_type:complete
LKYFTGKHTGQRILQRLNPFLKFKICQWQVISEKSSGGEEKLSQYNSL